MPTCFSRFVCWCRRKCILQALRPVIKCLFILFFPNKKLRLKLAETDVSNCYMNKNICEFIFLDFLSFLKKRDVLRNVKKLRIPVFY